jgi:calcineurin-like phosphoesterase family protein
MKILSNNVWVTSDTHYSHSNLCLSTTNWDTSTDRGLDAVRDFPSLEIMNETLVDNINNNVEENDWLIHLGDWSFGGFEKIQEFRDQINCKNIVLMLGNHDHHILNNEQNVRKLFAHVAHYEELKITRSKKEKAESFVLCHYPIISWNGMRKGVMMLHGHQHLKREDRFGSGKRMDVGICGSPDFRPYHLDEILLLMKDRETSYHH